jgi:surface protein
VATNGVTVLCTDAAVGESGPLNGITYTKRTRNQITTGNASTTCTSGITDMTNLFQNATTFNEDISTWDVSSVTTMLNMFRNAYSFNQDISAWDVSGVTSMQDLFYDARTFNQDISSWDVSNVTLMQNMFRSAFEFTGDIGGWDVSSVTTMRLMFRDATAFNSDISDWDVSSVTTMDLMFFGATAFNSNIGDWDVSNVTIMQSMFQFATMFNQDLRGWCVQEIPSEPTDFATSSALTPENYPTWGTCPVVLTASLAGNNEGWRMLGASVSGATYRDLLSGLWTQGFPGASFEDGASNVYWYDETTRQFNQPANATNIIGSSSNDGFNNAGRGFVAYVYEDDFNDGTSTEWPKNINVIGVPFTGDTAVSYTRTELPEDIMQGWHIATNPYPFPISWTALVADSALEDMIPAIFVYDANANDGSGGYRVHYGFDLPDLPGSIAYDGIIAPFQGFWVRTAGTAPEGSITFKESYETTGGTLFDEPEQPDFFALSIEGESLEASAVLLLDEDASVSTSKPVPFSAEMIRFGFLKEGDLQPDVFRSTEAVDGDQLIIPLDFAAVNSGTYTLNLNGSGLSEIESIVILRDQLTGAEHHLSPDNPYTFIYDAQQKLASNKEGFNPKTALMDSKNLLLESEHRFELRIQFGNATSTEPVSELPTVVALDQNYPNPFNPTTQIQYALPESGSVRLDVYNVMGQRVATLVNDQKPAGYHTVTFDARRLASGTYLYRLQTGNQVITKKLLLIK